MKEPRWYNKVSRKKCEFCGLPLDPDTKSLYDGVCTFCVESIDEYEGYIDDDPVFSVSEFE